MNKYKLIEDFFSNPEDYVKFFVSLKERHLANEEGTCMAQLTKKEGYLFYKLTWLADGRFVGEHIQIFKPSLENITKFNKGTIMLAKMLENYIDNNDITGISEARPFKDLTYNK